MNLIDYLLFGIGYWLWCLIFFVAVQKTVFAAANIKISPQRPRLTDIAAIYGHGYVSDAIVASYLTAVPLIAGLIHAIAPAFELQWVLLPYNIIVAVALGLITVSDAALYGFWNSKIDASVFAYLRHPKGAFASVSGAYLAAGFTLAAIIGGVFWLGANGVTLICKHLWHAESLRWWDYAGAPLLFIVCIGALFAIIRGLKIRPNNPSIVYFSPIAFFNHWALNPAYNMIYSLGTRNEFAGKFQAFPQEEAQTIFKEMFPAAGTPTKRLLRTDRPNILVVVWESFGAEFCGAVGGREDVTPCFNALSREGVLFTHCRASSFRTDRALPAIFCGLPGQPTTSIVRYTRKLPSLPAFPRELRKIGYETTAVHGGDLSIMHKSDFYLSSGHSRLIAQKDFPQSLEQGKWGIHDGPVMDWLYDDIMRLDATGKPWMTTVQTLSSHEPFTVPYRRLEDAADNSMAYTDSALGRLTDRLKKTDVWDNLLLIVVADHGLNRSNTPADRDGYSTIPLLFTGGAMAQPRRIDTIMSQTDIAATLLGQMGLKHNDFIFSRDVMADTYKNPSSFHTYNNGFLFTDSTGITDFDNIRDTAAEGTADNAREKKGKAILQILYDYINKL